MFALAQLALTNILLSSDNVLAIALMSQGVRHGRRALAVLWSLAASLALELGILALMAWLFRFAWLQMAFGLVISGMAVPLLSAPARPPQSALPHGMHWTVLRITAGNLMTSFENEVALIALAHGHIWLAWAGVLVTAPLVFFGSHLVVAVLHRHPVIRSAGAVYLFSIGTRLIATGAAPEGWGAGAAWSLTALFALFALVRCLRTARARRPTARVDRGPRWGRLPGGARPGNANGDG